MKILAVPLFLFIILLYIGCSKSSDTSNLYIPTTSDTTVNATLAELQQGRVLYVANCEACHSLYSPDSYTPSQWKSYISRMAPKTSMNSTEITLVTKYVSRGKQ